MTTEKDIESFQNPTGDWSLGGPFSIELTDDHPDLVWLPASTEINGNVITVKIGFAEQSMGGIQFYSKAHPFSFSYRTIKAIRNGKGDLFWVNKYL